MNEETITPVTNSLQDPYKLPEKRYDVVPDKSEPGTWKVVGWCPTEPDSTYLVVYSIETREEAEEIRALLQAGLYGGKVHRYVNVKISLRLVPNANDSQS